MKNEICYLIEDLIPSYIDEVVTDESKNIMDEHFKTCKECKKKLEAMRGDVIPEAEVKDADLYDKELLKKVSESVKKKTDRSNYTAIVAIVLAVIIFAVLFLPVIPVSPSKLTVDVQTDTEENGKLQFGNREGNFEYWTSISDTAVLLYPEDKQKEFDDMTFREITAEGAGDMLMALSDKYDSFEGINVVRISSRYVIKRYRTTVETDQNGQNVFVVKGVKTSLAGMLLSGRDSENTVTVINFDRFDTVTYKKTGPKAKVLWEE